MGNITVEREALRVCLEALRAVREYREREHLDMTAAPYAGVIPAIARAEKVLGVQ